MLTGGSANNNSHNRMCGLARHFLRMQGWNHHGTGRIPYSIYLIFDDQLVACSLWIHIVWCECCMCCVLIIVRCLSWRRIWLAQEVCNGAPLTSSLEQAVCVLPLPVPPCTHTHAHTHTLVFTHTAPLLSLYHPSVRKKTCNTILYSPAEILILY